METTEVRQELGRQYLADEAANINKLGRKHLDEVDTAERFTKARTAFYESHHDMADAGMLKTVEYGSFLVGLVLIYLLDLFLFGGAAEYLAAQLGDGGVAITLAKYGIPACFLGIEVLIALKIDRASQDVKFAYGSRRVRNGWIALGILVALVMPLIGTATAQAAEASAGSSTPVLMVIVLAIMSLAAHLLVLFGGKVAHEAKSYLAFAALRKRHDVRTARARRRAAASLDAFTNAFIRYAHELREYNRRHTPPLPSGLFDGEVVELLRRSFPHVASGAAAPVFPLFDEEDEP